MQDPVVANAGQLLVAGTLALLLVGILMLSSVFYCTKDEGIWQR
jgi:hypothetical protein